MLDSTDDPAHIEKEVNLRGHKTPDRTTSLCK